MALTKEEYQRLDFAVREIEDILGDISICGAISVMVGLKQGPNIFNSIVDNLENLERGD